MRPPECFSIPLVLGCAENAEGRLHCNKVVREIASPERVSNLSSLHWALYAGSSGVPQHIGIRELNAHLKFGGVSAPQRPQAEHHCLISGYGRTF